MRNLEQYLELAETMTVKVGGFNVTMITKEEVQEFISNVHGQTFTNMSQAKKLTNLSYLGSINGSTKVMKGMKEFNVPTYIVYLKPYKTAFGNVCAMGANCIDICLDTSGRVLMDKKEMKILRARAFRTILFYVNRDYFNAWLFAEINSAVTRYPDVQIRVNGTSDISPLMFKVNGVNMLQAFPDAQFYDYTKISKRIELTNTYSNYHITFSYDGDNKDQCIEALNKGINVAVVFDGDIPKSYWGYNVFSMDKTDLRSFDTAQGEIGYLKLKKTLNPEKTTNFVQDNVTI